MAQSLGFDEEEWISNIFIINYKWIVIIGSNLNLVLKLLF